MTRYTWTGVAFLALAIVVLLADWAWSIYSEYRIARDARLREDNMRKYGLSVSERRSKSR
jgi:hypothetical protein